MKLFNNRSKNEFSKQSGSSLPFALIALTGLSLMGVSMMRSTDTSTQVAGNLGFRETAIRATDVALEVAADLLLDVADRTISDNTKSYHAFVANPLPAVPVATRFSAYAHDATTGVKYRYSIERLCRDAGKAQNSDCVMKDDSPFYRITGETIGSKNASQISQTYVTLKEGKGPCGIMTNESIKVSGSTSSLGLSKCFHSNVDMIVDGEVTSTNPKLTISAAATAAYKDGPHSVVEVEPPNQPIRTLPEVNPKKHRGYATQIFDAKGTIKSGYGFEASDWEFVGGGNDARWVLKTNRFTGGSQCPGGSTGGLFYFEANVEIPNGIGMGLSSSPCKMSIISEKSIIISAALNIENFRDSSSTVPALTNDIFLMSGGDLMTNGSSSYKDPKKSGIIAAGSQFKVEGKLDLEASLIARGDPQPPDSIDITPENIMAGELQQTYDGNASTVITDGVTRHSWRSTGLHS